MTPRVNSTADDDRFWRVRPWATVGGLCFVLLLWNWTLTLALAIALVSGVGIYLGQERRLTIQWLRQSRAWKHHQSLWVALLSSVALFSVTYGLIRVWQDSDTPWLVTGILLQGIGTLAALGYLVWDRAHSRPNGFHVHAMPPMRPFQDLLQDLTHADAIVRFLAVRQITSQALTLAMKSPTGDGIGDMPVWTVADIRHCLQLLHEREQEPIVRQAIQEAIARLQGVGMNRTKMSSDVPNRSASSSVVAIPTLLRTRAKRPTYESADPQAVPQSVLSQASVLIPHA